MRRVAVLGSTGSIGVRALEIIQAMPGLRLHSILCRRSSGLLAEQKDRYRPVVSCMTDPEPGAAPPGTVTGEGALASAIEGADIVLNAIVGSAGLSASILCMEFGIPLALANKESLVIGGILLKRHLEAGLVIPVDSEHSTVFRCLKGEGRPVLEIILTASGGSARSIPEAELENAGPERILRHPTWDMGSRITVDSATMVNKAFEIIEAGWLFRGVPVRAVLHPQSIVHSLVRLGDGCWKALLGCPDMGVPIQYALAWPEIPLERLGEDSPLDWQALEFSALDRSRYPAFEIVTEAGEEGGSAPAAANAADEVAVQAFLDGRISFGDISRVIGRVMEAHAVFTVSSFGDVMEADAAARAAAERTVLGLC
jgi:1-deoxy-D-xylulose-5-phosphate reductoisomerase